MRYAALLTNTSEDIARWETMSEDEARTAREAEVPKWNALFEELGATGKIVNGSELEEPASAKTVRVRNGETVVTDGPYAETKELLGGLMILDCDDLDEAIAIAARIPIAERGSVELRPLIEH